MGCVSSEVHNNESLRGELLRIKYACDIYKIRKGEELQAQEKALSMEFVKPVHNRNKQLERAIILGNVRIFNQKLSTCETIKSTF